jgi:hypothetical protein
MTASALFEATASIASSVFFVLYNLIFGYSFFKISSKKEFSTTETFLFFKSDKLLISDCLFTPKLI